MGKQDELIASFLGVSGFKFEPGDFVPCAPSDQQLIVKFVALCEKHGMPFFGTVDIRAVRAFRWLGVPNMQRLVDKYTHTYTNPYKLAEQLAQVLQPELLAESVSVLVKSRHTCSMLKGYDTKIRNEYTYPVRDVKTETEGDTE